MWATASALISDRGSLRPPDEERPQVQLEIAMLQHRTLSNRAIEKLTVEKDTVFPATLAWTRTVVCWPPSGRGPDARPRTGASSGAPPRCRPAGSRRPEPRAPASPGLRIGDVQRRGAGSARRGFPRAHRRASSRHHRQGGKPCHSALIGRFCSMFSVLRNPHFSLGFPAGLQFRPRSLDKLIHK